MFGPEREWQIQHRPEDSLRHVVLRLGRDNLLGEWPLVAAFHEEADAYRYVVNTIDRERDEWLRLRLELKRGGKK